MNQIATRDETREVAEASESAAIFQIIERAARDPNVDIDKMQRLYEMREAEMSRIAAKAFNAAMRAAQAEMEPVVRDADNDQTRSKYARYETISEAIRPVIAKHGFSLSYGEGKPDRENCIRIICDVSHEGGYTKQYHADVPIDNVGMKGNPNKTATHAYGSTKSYGKRYLKCDIFDIALKNEDDDGNAAVSEPISEEQLVTIRDLIESVEADTAKFCAFMGVASLPDIPTSRFNEAVTALNQHGAKHGKTP